MLDDKIFESYSLSKGRYHVILNEIDMKIKFSNYPILVGFNELNNEDTDIQYYLTYDSRMEPLNNYFIENDPAYSLEAVYYGLQKHILSKYNDFIKNLSYYEYKRFKGRFPIVMTPIFLDAHYIGNSSNFIGTIFDILSKFTSNGIMVPDITIFNADSLNNSEIISSYILKEYVNRITLINHEDICAPVAIIRRLINSVSEQFKELSKPICYQTSHNCNCNDKMSDYYKDPLKSEMGKYGRVIDKEL